MRKSMGSQIDFSIVFTVDLGSGFGHPHIQLCVHCGPWGARDPNAEPLALLKEGEKAFSTANIWGREKCERQLGTSSHKSYQASALLLYFAACSNGLLQKDTSIWWEALRNLQSYLHTSIHTYTHERGTPWSHLVIPEKRHNSINNTISLIEKKVEPQRINKLADFERLIECTRIKSPNHNHIMKTMSLPFIIICLALNVFVVCD